MLGKITTSLLLGATLMTGAAAPAEARKRHYWDDHGRYDRHYAGRDGYYHRNHYGRGYQRRCYDKGNGGLAIGAIAGGLLGNTVAGHGDKTLGTVLGAAGGGLLGRSIDRSDGRRC